MSATDGRADFPAYFWRWGKPYVAWFCVRESAESFLEYGSDPVEGNVFSFLAAVGDTPEPDVEYEDLGHGHCGWCIGTGGSR